MIGIRTATIGVACALLGGAAVGGIAVASIPDANWTVHGCISGGPSSGDPNPAGTLRVIDPTKQKCPTGDSPLTLNQPRQINAASDATRTALLPAVHRTTMLTTSITLPTTAAMYPQFSVDVTAGKQNARLVLRLLLDGKVDEGPIAETIPAHQTHNLAGVLNCNGVPAGKHTLAIALTSNVAGVTVATRTFVVAAAVPLTEH